MMMAGLWSCGSDDAPEVVPVQEIKVVNAEISLDPETSVEVASLVVVYPGNATNTVLKATSSDESVVRVSDGKLIAVASGKANVVIETTDGSKLSVTIHVFVPNLNPLTFTAEEAGAEVRLTTSGVVGSEKLSFEVSTDGKSWTSYYLGNTVTLPEKGDRVSFRNSSDEVAKTFSKSSSSYYVFSGNDKKVSASGNVMSLLDKRCKTTDVPENAFCFLFSGFTSLTTAPELPGTTLGEYCYFNTFKDCTGMTVGPKELPAPTLARGSYECMFSNCTALTVAPEMPATTLAEECYECMFTNCDALLAAPKLPAKTLEKRCYRAMFQLCDNLTYAPYLPATTLTEKCYEYMFSGCVRLSSVTIEATNLSAANCMDNWLQAAGTAYSSSSAGGTTEPTLYVPAVVLNNNVITTWCGKFKVKSE